MVIAGWYPRLADIPHIEATAPSHESGDGEEAEEGD